LSISRDYFLHILWNKDARLTGKEQKKQYTYKNKINSIYPLISNRLEKYSNVKYATVDAGRTLKRFGNEPK